MISIFRSLCIYCICVGVVTKIFFPGVQGQDPETEPEEGGLSEEPESATGDYEYEKPSDTDWDQSQSRFLKFTYGDNDTLGPSAWRDLEDGFMTTNACDDVWRSPLNIRTELASAHERIKFEEEFDEKEEFVSSLIFNFNLDIQNRVWKIGYPYDTFHGIVVRAPDTNMFQVVDRFDPVVRENEHIMFDFQYATIHACDIKKHRDRSMHQVDGKKFPFEIDMIFFKNSFGIGIDPSLLNDNLGVMVAVLGDIGTKDNPRIDPLIQAVKRFRGPKEFNLDHQHYDERYKNTDYTVPPWSITWLIPDVSTYYYYNDGSLSIPPCYPLSRVYVIKEPILMSRKQFNVLINISTEREPTGILDCSFSVLQDDLDDVRYNSNEYNIKGFDDRPMSHEEIVRVQQKEAKDAKERKRIEQIRKGQLHG